jgi:hypothetical protein
MRSRRCREEKLAGLSNSTQFTISLYQDGENESPALTLILSGWSAVWGTRYGAYGDLQFQPPLNLKDEKTRSGHFFHDQTLEDLFSNSSL